MQITPLGSSTSAPGRRIAEEAVARSNARDRAPEQPTELASRAPGRVLRGGLRTVEPGLNREVSAAQQALNFLDKLQGSLQGLKSTLSARLADYKSGDPEGQIEDQLRRFASLWRQRQAATAGSLDGRLALVGPGEARQTFTVRGLDLAVLRSGGRELLSFSVAGKQGMSASVEPGLDDATLVRRIDRALAPAAVRAEKDPAGRLILTTPEATWPSVRDSLAIKGDGLRFPTGQFNRVRAEAEEEAIRPQHWHAQDVAAIRQSLREVITALDLVRQARDVIGRVLEHAANDLGDAAGGEETEWASAFTRTFQAATSRPDFHVFSAIAPALVAINRHRVVSLLSLA